MGFIDMTAPIFHNILPFAYIGIATAWVVIAFIWLLNCIWNCKKWIALHFWLSLIPVVKLLFCSFAIVFWFLPHQPLGLKIGYSVAEGGAQLYVLLALLLVSTGWCLIRKRLFRGSGNLRALCIGLPAALISVSLGQMHHVAFTYSGMVLFLLSMCVVLYNANYNAEEYAARLPYAGRLNADLSVEVAHKLRTLEIFKRLVFLYALLESCRQLSVVFAHTAIQILIGEVLHIIVFIGLYVLFRLRPPPRPDDFLAKPSVIDTRSNPALLVLQLEPVFPQNGDPSALSDVPLLLAVRHDANHKLVRRCSDHYPSAESGDAV